MIEVWGTLRMVAWPLAAFVGGNIVGYFVRFFHEVRDRQEQESRSRVVVELSWSAAQRLGIAEVAEDPDEYARDRCREMGWRSPP